MLLALDPSTTAVGWALFDGNQYRDSGVFTPHGNADERIVAIGRWLETWPWDRVDTVACELPTGDHANRDTDRKLGGVFYLCMYVARTHGAEFYTVYPVQIKAVGVHKGNLEAAQRYVRDATGDETREVGEHEADALGVALAFLRVERRWTE
ncbi:MAG: hypothetical protein PVJ86_04030 [Phycisphaerales bacterium]|jgi:Holliday junction resolvasome RuvABC endonuclease subunit